MGGGAWLQVGLRAPAPRLALGSSSRVLVRCAGVHTTSTSDTIHGRMGDRLGIRPLRREVRDLQRNFPDQFDLYILGLQNLQGLNEAQLTSYYQLAGIHGMPFKPWNGVGSDTDWQSTSGFGGYCTHSSILFLPWHRPYLALYEQSLYVSVQAVAKKFPAGAVRDRYVAAAKDFRAPYFDWASQPPAGSSAFPSILTSSTIRVTDVDGATKSVTNPLYRFSFHPVNPVKSDFSAQVSRDWPTVAFLSSWYNAAPYSTFSAEGGESQSEDTALEPFWDKSGTRFWTSAAVKDSSATFGYAYPETQKWRYASTAAYQASIRQAVTALYGSNVFTNFVANIATQPQQLSLRAAATPVTEAKEEEVGKKSLVGAAAASLKAKTAGGDQKPLAAAPPKVEVAEIKTGTVTPEGPIPAALAHLAPNNTYTEYILNVRALKHGLGQSFRLLVFLGPFDAEHPDAWDTEFNCVGRVSVLGRSPETTACAKCRGDAAEGLMVSGTVPLTSALLQDIVAGQLGSLRPEEVVPYLREHLQWRVALFDGQERRVEEVPGLKVGVASTEVVIGADGLPAYSGSYVVRGEVTEGKPGGLGVGEV
ncbi:hypothetical protein B0T17DRAFT_531175 [Bombardia bombarda]|uniref:tyrosinase n=1 Tax=Bombardia bombarda TaxID=252184 RepID=A0AA39X068_9PEZI|nr:hypothetical protein B0T17DRAFT_531175 [Bombardia bombarda]